MNICRACAIERNIRRSKRWTALGKCPLCGERHILFTAQSESPIGDVAVALLEAHPSLTVEDAVYYARELEGVRTDE